MMKSLPILPGMKNCYVLLRHGHSLANEKHMVVSTMEHGVKPEYGLSPTGKEQAERAGLQLQLLLNKMPPGIPVHIVSSPFSRAMETAIRIGQHVNIKPEDIEVKEGLRERYFGKDLELKTHANESYAATHKEDEASNGSNGPGDGESANAVAERFMAVVNALEAKYSGSLIILSSHGDTCTIGQQAITGKPVGTHYQHPLANCELRFFTEKEGHITHHAVDSLKDGYHHLC